MNHHLAFHFDAISLFIPRLQFVYPFRISKSLFVLLWTPVSLFITSLGSPRYRTFWLPIKGSLHGHYIRSSITLLSKLDIRSILNIPISVFPLHLAYPTGSGFPATPATFCLVQPWAVVLQQHNIH